MRTGDRWMMVAIAVGGTGTCVAAVIHFLFVISTNRLAWEPDIREHYLAVGHSYTQGFVVGFFLCLSLAIAAVSLASWRERRKAALQLSASDER